MTGLGRSKGGRGWRPLIGFVVGLALIAAAIYAVVQDTEGLERAIDSARHASPWLIVLAVVLPLANAGVVATSFWVLMRRLGSVPMGDMFALIASAWLLNYLPLRPGLVGRLAFHKLVHRVSVRSSVAVSVALALLTALAAGHMLLVGLSISRDVYLGIGVLVVSSLLVFVAAGFTAGRVEQISGRDLRTAIGLRYVDMAVWSVRMWACFSIIGTPIDPGAALLIAAAVQLAYLFPLTGAGMGVVEWAVALIAGYVVVGATPEAGIAASLVNRAAELVAAIPAGLAGVSYIAKRRALTRHHGLSEPSTA